MITNDQFEANCNRLDAKLIIETARQRKFIEMLEQAIVNIPLQQFPELKQYKHLFIDEISHCAHQHAVNLNELLDLNLGGYTNDDNSILLLFTIPERDVTLEEQHFLTDTLKFLPIEQHETFIKLNNQRVKEEAEERTCVFRCYDKTKELIAKYFPEIIEFTGNTIRNIDRNAYLTMQEWVIEFYFHVGLYLNDSSKE